MDAFTSYLFPNLFITDDPGALLSLVSETNPVVGNVDSFYILRRSFALKHHGDRSILRLRSYIFPFTFIFHPVSIPPPPLPPPTLPHDSANANVPCHVIDYFLIDLLISFSATCRSPFSVSFGNAFFKFFTAVCANLF